MCLVPGGHFKKWSETGSFLTFWLANVLLATAVCDFTSQLQKVVRACSVLYILTSKCASRYSGVQFFHIATSKSGPDMVCFVHLTCKCASRHSGVQFFHIPTSKVVRSWCVFLNILACKCTSRFTGVQFFHIPTSKSGPDMVCFVHFDLQMPFSLHRRAIFISPLNSCASAPAALASLLFDRRPTNHWKNITFRDFANILRECIFFLLTLVSSESASLLCFSSLHVVGS